MNCFDLKQLHTGFSTRSVIFNSPRASRPPIKELKANSPQAGHPSTFHSVRPVPLCHSAFTQFDTRENFQVLQQQRTPDSSILHTTNFLKGTETRGKLSIQLNRLIVYSLSLITPSPQIIKGVERVACLSVSHSSPSTPSPSPARLFPATRRRHPAIPHSRITDIITRQFTC